MDIRKKRTLIIIGIFIVVLSLVEFSYALWKITWSQTDENIVNLDCFKISFTETPNSAVHLQNAFPLTDEEGSNLTPYHFTITNECESRASYTIQLESKDTSTLDESYLKIMLNKETPKLTTALSEGMPTKNLGTDKAYVLETGTLNAKDTKEYDFRVWLDESVTTETEGIQNEKWSGMITLNTSYKPPISNKGVLRKINSIYDLGGVNSKTDTEGMWGYKDQITKVVFENKLEPHEEVEGILSFDESVDDDHSVMSYLVPNDDDPQKYTAYIQADGGVKANPDSSYLFFRFENVSSIEGLENFDTSNVWNMSHMFLGIHGLTTFDLGDNFDTSNVTDMNFMFYYMSKLTSLNLGKKFDTSKVIDMHQMFDSITNLKTLDLSQSNFNTSNVKDMGYMFRGLEKLTSLNLGENFDTSNVTEMYGIFNYMSSLKELDLSQYRFNTSQVTSMLMMFDGMSSLTTLNLGENFDTSNVTNMDGMFEDMTSLTALNLGNNFDTSNVINMNGMFEDMSSLTALNLGNNFDTSKVTDMYRMFYGDSNLSKIDYGEFFIHKTEANTSMMFRNCPAEKPSDSSWDGVTDWE